MDGTAQTTMEARMDAHDREIRDLTQMLRQVLINSGAPPPAAPATPPPPPAPQAAPGHTDYVYALAIQDSKLYSGSLDNTIKVWSLEAGDFGREITTLSGHTDTVSALAIQDSKLYSGSDDKTIKVWSV